MYINISIGYYKKNKERLQKEACGRYQNLLEEKKIESVNMLSNVIKIFLK